MKKPLLRFLSMPVLVLAAFIAVGSAADAQQSASSASPPSFKSHELTRAEFDALLAHPEHLLLIDLRRPDEVSRIGGFPVYLSIPAADLEKNLSWIPTDRTIVTISNHRTRSGRAADLLAAKGFKVAGRLGAQLYEEQGGRLTKIAPSPTSSTANAAAAAGR